MNNNGCQCYSILHEMWPPLLRNFHSISKPCSRKRKIFILGITSKLLHMIVDSHSAFKQSRMKWRKSSMTSFLKITPKIMMQICEWLCIEFMKVRRSIELKLFFFGSKSITISSLWAMPNDCARSILSIFFQDGKATFQETWHSV